MQASEQNVTVPRGNLQRNRVDRSRQPPWPEHSGAERLSGQWFKDAATTDGGGRLRMRPATQLVRGSALGD